MSSDEKQSTGESTFLRRDRFRDHLYKQVQWGDIDPVASAELIDRAAREDLDGKGFTRKGVLSGDPTSEIFIPAELSASAVLVARQPMTVAGLPMIPEIIHRFDPTLESEALVEDGDFVKEGTALARISGSARSLFTAERTVLNFIQMLSGVATETRRMTSLLEESSTRLLDTRKTHPGYRALIKYAVAAGGGWNHRLGLYDRIMLKDNHLGTVTGSSESRITDAVAKAKEERPDLPIEVEIDSLEQLAMVLKAGPDVILLDNFSPKEITEALRVIEGQVLTEISGNVTFENIPALAGLGADFISTGATVHQSCWVDIGLDLER